MQEYYFLFSRWVLVSHLCWHFISSYSETYICIFLTFFLIFLTKLFYFLLVFAFLNSAVAVFTCDGIKTSIWMRKYFPQQKCKCVLEALTFLSLSSNLTKVSLDYFVRLAQSIWLCLSNSVGEEGKASRKNIFSL